MKTDHLKSGAIKLLEDIAFKRIKEQHPNFPYPVKPKYTDKTANGLTKCVIDYIRFRGYQSERINCTGQYINGKWVKGSSQPGTADISATIQGRSVKIEIKCKASGDHYQSDEQKEYQKQIEAAGGVYLIVRTFEGFYKWFNKKE